MNLQQQTNPAPASENETPNAEANQNPNESPNQTPNPNGPRIGILTSGGDAQGMNAAVRAVIRTALVMGAQPYAVHEGWQGAVDGGDMIRPLTWSDASGILNEGGTVIGTARCAAFRERDGLRIAAKHLLENGIDRLIVIGGDGSLSGTDEFRREWPSLLDELVDRGEITSATAAAHPALMIVGLVGSIDNDLVGSDMTIGADTALHRIVDAIDQLSSTAASHQRTFVVEVMGRHCGYLGLMSSVAGGCDYLFIPEQPPTGDWRSDMCQSVQEGRAAGRRESLIIVAEGAIDADGNPITSAEVAQVLNERLDANARVTILGHVQRGGTPSAYDRWMPTLLGYAAVQEVLEATPEDEAYILGVRHNRISRINLVEAVANTRAVARHIENKDFSSAQVARGSSFLQMLEIHDIMTTAPNRLTAAPTGKRIAIMHVGGLAPGMNTAARAAVRLGIGKGHTVLGIQGSFNGLIDGKVRELDWSDVEGWAFKGGAELGTRRPVPETEHLYAISRSLETHGIDALVMIGGLNGYLAIHKLMSERDRYPSFNLPMLCVPASIDNNLPGSELSIGADTALNNAVWALDRIKESAAASRRCFVAEAMGRKCGYLAFMAGLSSGAEMVYLNEDGLDLARIARDAKKMRFAFEQGRRLFLLVTNEEASEQFDLPFLAKAFEEEGQGLYDVRASALGHLQQGGSPTPFDRLLATRIVHRAIDEVTTALAHDDNEFAAYLGVSGGEVVTYPLDQIRKHLDLDSRRPKDQWWLDMRPVGSVVSMPGAGRGEAIPVLRYE